MGQELQRAGQTVTDTATKAGQTVAEGAQTVAKKTTELVEKLDPTPIFNSLGDLAKRGTALSGTVSGIQDSFARAGSGVANATAVVSAVEKSMATVQTRAQELPGVIGGIVDKVDSTQRFLRAEIPAAVGGAFTNVWQQNIKPAFELAVTKGFGTVRDVLERIYYEAIVFFRSFDIIGWMRDWAHTSQATLAWALLGVLKTASFLAGLVIGIPVAYALSLLASAAGLIVLPFMAVSFLFVGGVGLSAFWPKKNQ